MRTISLATRYSASARARSKCACMRVLSESSPRSSTPASSAGKLSFAKPQSSNRAYVHAAAASTRWRLSCERATDTATNLREASPAHTRSSASRDSAAPRRSGSQPKADATVLSTTSNAWASRAARPSARRSGTHRPKPPIEFTNHHRCGPSASNEASKFSDAATNAATDGSPTIATSQASKPLANVSAKSSANATRRSPGRTIPSCDRATGTCGPASNRASRAPALKAQVSSSCCTSTRHRPFINKNPRCGCSPHRGQRLQYSADMRRIA